MRATRAYIAGLGTAGSLVGGAAVLFVLASTVVTFTGWPQLTTQVSPPAVVAAPARSVASAPGAGRLTALVNARALGFAAAAGGAGGTVGGGPGGGVGGGTGAGRQLLNVGQTGLATNPGTPVTIGPANPVPPAACDTCGSTPSGGSLGGVVQSTTSAVGGTVSATGADLGSTVSGVAGAVAGKLAGVSAPVAGAVQQTGAVAGSAVGGAGGAVGGVVSGVGQTLGGLLRATH